MYLGRMHGSAGFSRTVAIKRLHPQLATDGEFLAMLVDEARLAAQIRHVNVVDTLDLVAAEGAFSLVLEYIEGESLSALVRSAKRHGEAIPRPIALAIFYGVLRGLEAAHEARDEEGQPLGIVHRDISPQNVLVGVDGIPRIIDFGIAKALGRIAVTKPGEVRGKFAYMAPEQLMSRPVTRQADVYAAGVVLWELLTGARLFEGDDERAVCAAVLRGAVRPPIEVEPNLPAALSDVVLKATSRDLTERHLTARELLEALAPWDMATDDEVGAWVRRLAAEALAKRYRLVQSSAPLSEPLGIDALLATLAEAEALPRAPALGDDLDGATEVMLTPPVAARSPAPASIAGGPAPRGPSLSGPLDLAPLSASAITRRSTVTSGAPAGSSSAPAMGADRRRRRRGAVLAAFAALTAALAGVAFTSARGGATPATPEEPSSRSGAAAADSVGAVVGAAEESLATAEMEALDLYLEAPLEDEAPTPERATPPRAARAPKRTTPPAATTRVERPSTAIDPRSYR